jgi:integrase
MAPKSKHVRGTSVVDIHAAKRKAGKKNADVGKRWLGRAQVPGTRRFRTKAWETEDQAWHWAEDMLSKMKLGIDHGRACTIRGLREEYLANLAGRNCSPGHVAQCEYVLDLALAAGINDLRDEHLAYKVEAFIHGLKAQTKTKEGKVRRRTKTSLSARTKNAYLNHLLALVSYAHKRRYLPIDPLHGVVDKVRGPKKLKPVFTLDELDVIFGPDGKREERFWLPLALTIYAGLRIGEAVYLEWQDIDFATGHIRVRNKPQYRLKNQKERLAPLPEGLAKELRPLAQLRGWVCSEHLRKHKTTWRHWFMRLLKKHGISPDARSPHSGRHTWASKCAAEGMSPFEIKEYAGHSSLQTTMGYCLSTSMFRTELKQKLRDQNMWNSQPTFTLA